jgi:hypothetical protein
LDDLDFHVLSLSQFGHAAKTPVAFHMESHWRKRQECRLPELGHTIYPPHRKVRCQMIQL